MSFSVAWGGWSRPAPPVRWLVSNLIPEASVTMLSAEPGSYKSYIVLELAVSVATGRSALGRLHTRQGRALYVDFDGGESITRRRLSQLANGNDLPGFGYISGAEIGNVFDDRLWDYLSAEPPEMLIVDTLAAGSPGIDENDKRFGDVLIKARLLAQSSGTSSVFLHHLNAMGGVRGSSALRGNPDCDYRAELLNPTSVRVVCKKIKHAERTPTFVVDVGGIDRGEGIFIRD